MQNMEPLHARDLCMRLIIKLETSLLTHYILLQTAKKQKSIIIKPTILGEFSPHLFGCSMVCWVKYLGLQGSQGSQVLFL